MDKEVASVLELTQRIFLVVLLLAAAVFLFGYLGFVEARDSRTKALERFNLVSRYLTFSMEVVSDVREHLFRGPETESLSEAERVTKLIADVDRARTLVTKLVERLSRTSSEALPTGLSTDIRKELNERLTDLSKTLHHENLYFAETGIGRMLHGKPLDETPIYALVRIAIVASAHPTTLNRDFGALGKSDGPLLEADITNLWIGTTEIASDLVLSERSQARSTQIWVLLQTASTKDWEIDSLIKTATTKSLSELVPRLARELDKHEAVERGEVTVTLPGTPGPIRMQYLILLYPWLLAVGYLLCILTLAHAKTLLLKFEAEIGDPERLKVGSRGFLTLTVSGRVLNRAYSVVRCLIVLLPVVVCLLTVQAVITNPNWGWTPPELAFLLGGAIAIVAATIFFVQCKRFSTRKGLYIGA